MLGTRSRFLFQIGEKPRVRPALDSYLEILRDLNPIVVSFLGGEPFSRKDLERLINAAKYDAGVPHVQVTTNGSFLTLEKYVAVSEAGLDRLNISLDYATEAHDTSRGIKGLYEKITEFVKEVRAKGIKGAEISLNTIYMADSVKDTEELAKFAREQRIQITLFPYSLVKNANGSHDLALQREVALKNFDRLWAQYRDVITNPDAVMGAMMEFIEKGFYPGKCDAGRSFMWVKPDGTYMACIDLPHSRAESLEEVRRFKDTNECQSCYLPCRGSPEMAAHAQERGLYHSLFKDFARIKGIDLGR